jgi:hypothetical protein
MAPSSLLKDETFLFKDGLFEARIKIFEVSRSLKFPDGLKVQCVLIDMKNKIPRLLLDNHEPYGYHLHSKLPHDKKFRISLSFTSYQDAVNFFLVESRKLVEI